MDWLRKMIWQCVKTVFLQLCCRYAAEVVFMKQREIYGNLLKEITEKVLRETLVSFI